MYVRHLSVADFRSYRTAEVPLNAGVTILVGANGQGKTNLVEAIGYVAALASHRVAADAPLVRHGAERAVVRVAAIWDGRESLVELEIVPGRANRARLNRAAATRPRDVLGTVRSVLFAPEDLALVKGDPAERRRFLDDLLVARQPRWAGVRSDYDRILRQRNALLKSAAPQLRRRGGGAVRAARRAEGTGDDALSTGQSTEVVPTLSTGSIGPEMGDADPRTSALHTLSVWNEQLAGCGAQLLYARLRLLSDLGPFLSSSYDAVSASTSRARATYRSSLLPALAERIQEGEVPTAEELRLALLQTLDGLRAQEIERGVSLAGPHRDEVLLTLSDLPARGYASHGESWSLALALRLSAFQLLRRDLRDDPVLILDDVFAELDEGRRSRLAEVIADAEQVLITAAVPDDIPASLRGVTLRVADGQVSAEPVGGAAEPAGGAAAPPGAAAAGEEAGP